MKRLVYAGIRALVRAVGRSLEDAPTGGAALIIAPHPDDEVLGCGGLIATRRAAMRDVHVVYLTDGSASHPGHPVLGPRELADLRAREAAEAMQALGVPAAALHFLNAPDSRLPHLGAGETAEFRAKLREIFAQVCPVEIFLPCAQDGSSEHEAAFRLVKPVISKLPSPARILEYPVWAWWRAILLIRPLLKGRAIRLLRFPDHARAKEAALSRYRSQFEALPPWTRPVLSSEFRRLFTNTEELFFA